MSFDLDAFGAIQAKASALPPRRKPPKHRHATPSGPWPFLDLDDKVDPNQLTSPPPQPKFDEDEETENGYGPVFDSRPYWSHYPQSQFANWTQWQQHKSGIARVINRRLPLPEHCRIFELDIASDGIFRSENVRSEQGDHVVKSGRVGSREVAESMENFWHVLGEKVSPPNARIKAFFVDNLSGPVLQMLGTKFHIEPFFFSSSLNSIPSRYQEQVRPGKGDHITLTLSFIRTLPSPPTAPPTPITSYTDSVINEDTLHMLQSSILMQAPIIDVEAPLVLTSNPNKLLVLDLLSLHVIRRKFVPESAQQGLPAVDSDKTLNGDAVHPLNRQESDESTSGMNTYGGISTIISYHLPSTPPFNTTSASTLHKRLLAAGRSVYWSHIFQSTVPSGDPTFVTLSLLWYPLYAWDEVLDSLLGEVAFLEAHTLSALPSDGQDEDAHDQTHVLTHQLHVIRAHLLHYESLLDDFRKTVEFLLKTVNPGLVQPTNPFSSPSHVAPLPTSYLQSPSSTTASQYPDSLRSALPERVGEAPSLATAARDTLEHVFENQEEDRGFLHSHLQSGSKAPQSSTRPNVRVRVQTGPSESETYERLLNKECTNLLNEIDRLEMTRSMLDHRLGNVMELASGALAFSSVNIEDSRRMKNLAEVSVRDSAVMKQISYLTMIFLPASFVAAIFGMNVIEINPDSYGTLPHYLAAAIPLTSLTVWVMMMQYHATKQRSRATTPSNLLDFVRVAPSSVWRKVWSAMWWPLRVLLNELSPWGSSRRNRNRRRRNSWFAPSPGTSLRTRATPSRPRSTVYLGEPLPVVRPAPSSLREEDVDVSK